MKERLGRLEDLAQLKDLLARYAAAIDNRDLDGLVELFAPDAVFEHSGRALRVRGHDEIRAFYRDALSRFGPSLHYSDCQIVRLSDTSASGRVTAHAEMGLDGTSVVAGLEYRDVYRRAGEGWLFAQRQVLFHYRLPLRELASRSYDYHH